MSIFVSVAAFCDPWLLQTVRDACAKAAQPQSLVFGVFEQDAEPRQAELQAVVDGCGATLRYRQVHPAASRGVCWARAQVGQMYGGEDHLLQIDSHMLFEPGWDARLLAQHAELRQRSAKPVISCYPWAFEIEDEQPLVKAPPSNTTTLVMRPVPTAELRPDNPTMMFRTEHIFARQPLPGCHVAGGFLFAGGPLCARCRTTRICISTARSRAWRCERGRAAGTSGTCPRSPSTTCTSSPTRPTGPTTGTRSGRRCATSVSRT